MRKLVIACAMLVMAFNAMAQELYVNTEPASNMAAHSLGIRLANEGYFEPVYKSREVLELMYGANKDWMVHGTMYISNFYHQNQHFEGGSAYAKYRFLSIDTVQRHFRGAFFGKISAINNPLYNQEISLDGDNSGVQGGVVFTQLLHKLALSGSASYLHAFNNLGGYSVPPENSRSSVGYTLSAGYLLFPRSYQNYNQVNLNLYAELLGKFNPGYQQSYLDVAPAVQLIFNSVFRVDFSYRTPIYDNMVRSSKNVYLVRLEYNLFNIFN